MLALITGLLIDFGYTELHKQNYRDNEALDGMTDVDMSTT